jgi:hypothetical protein
MAHHVVLVFALLSIAAALGTIGWFLLALLLWIIGV